MKSLNDRKWVDELLSLLSTGDLSEDSIQVCIEHMNRHHRQLYKYYDLASEFTMPNLELYANYYNDPSQFNDPFDCNIGLSVDQLFQLLLPVALQQLYPTWSEKMIAVVTAISLDKLDVDASEKNKEIVVAECRKIPQFKEFEESLAKGQFVGDYEIAQMLCKNPTILEKLLMHSSELPANLAEDEARQLAEFGSDLLLRMREITSIDTVEDEAVLNKVFGFFDGKHGFVERIFEAAKLLGVSIDEDAVSKLRDQCNERVAEIHKGVGRAVGIACFAQRWNNVLMWSHYANKHTGICVEYDFDIPFETAPNSLLLPVEYTSMRPLLPIERLGAIHDGNFIVDETKINSVFADVLKALITKSEIWKYEQEWRHIVFVKDPNKRLVSLPIVSRIIMGVNISDENKKKMVEYASNHNIPLYQAQLVEDRYEMELRKVQ